jgi:para-aminobenzoate synthetase/4-amino-4-deoxychorismate lyase
MDKIKPQSGFVRQHEVLIKENNNWLFFSNPHQIISAQKLEEVLPALQEIEKMIAVNNWYGAGFVSYEAASAFDSALQTHPGTEFPYVWFGLYSEPQIVTLPEPKAPKQFLEWLPTIDRESYDTAVAKIKHYIANGKTYQVNYSMRLQTDFTGRAWDLFLHLVQNQNKHAAYITTDQYVICSASPELFFQLDGNTITCCPMKGTTKRGRTTIEDNEQSQGLKTSEKNRAENVMIVDMIRNDLGKIAEVGSVSVPRLFKTERYPTLWQMTSTVTAKTNASLTEIFGALFPSGSITGAPKVSTMKIISELENTPRKIYTGTIGYISPQRKASFNVAIRTLLIDKKSRRAEYGIGGGIVWDSSSADEYAEAKLKAQVLTQPPPSFSLLETMFWEQGEGFFLREKHIARMLDSAAYFDIPILPEKLEEYLDQISSGFFESRRVRVLVDQEGIFSYESSLFEISDDSGTLNVCLAKEPVDSNNVFLFHKTTQREVYASARRGLEEWDDVLLYNELGELTEFTIGNLVVELNGQWLTPPISCGVLAGTFRAHLVETGQVLERKITIDRLRKCAKIFRVNSIRQWQRVEIQEQPAALWLKGNIL